MDRVFNWQPRLGTVGDQNFDLPHGTRMNGDFVKDIANVLVGFSSAAYPSFPNLGEVDAGLGANQIVAACNYKQDAINFLLSSPTLALSYIAAKSPKRVANALWSNIATRINSIRTFEGFDAYAFTAIAAGDLPRAWQLAERRKALALIGESVTEYGSEEHYSVPNPPFLGTYGNSNGSVNTGASTHSAGLGSGTSHGGTARHFRLLPWMADFSTARVEVEVLSATGTFTGELWLSNTNDRFYGSSANFLSNLNNLIGTFGAPGVYSFDITAHKSLLNGLGFASFIFTTTEQRTSSATRPGVYTATIQLVRDYGA